MWILLQDTWAKNYLRSRGISSYQEGATKTLKDIGFIRVLVQEELMLISYTVPPTEKQWDVLIDSARRSNVFMIDQMAGKTIKDKINISPNRISPHKNKLTEEIKGKKQKRGRNKDKTNSKTKILNTLSNVVFRAVLYGRKQEKMMIIQDIGSKIPAFALKWTKNDLNSQEIIFLRTLQLLLSQGLQAAENVIANRVGGNLNLNTIINDHNDQNQNSDISNTITNNNSNNNNVNFIGLYSNTAKNGEIDYINSINEIVSTRLYDTYQNAFYRVVECCFKEIGKRSNTVPQNSDVLLNIASWERDLRGELTNGLWIRHPTELAGVWTLSDVAGENELSFDEIEKERKRKVFSWVDFKYEKEVSIELTKDGKVIAQSDEFTGNIRVLMIIK